MKGVHNPDRLIDVAANPPELNEALEQVVIIDDLPPAPHGDEVPGERHAGSRRPPLQQLLFPLREAQMELNFFPILCQLNHLSSLVLCGVPT